MHKPVLLVEYVNDVYMKVRCEDVGVLYSISDHFSFFVQDYWFQPKYKEGIWDGKIRLLNRKNCNMYIGLLPYLKQYAKNFDCDIVVDPKCLLKAEVEASEIIDYIKNLDIHITLDPKKGPEPVTIRDYQALAVYKSLTNKRCVLLSATSSGKTLMMYCMIRYYLDKVNPKGKVLVVASKLQLVTQFKGDCEDYSHNVKWDADKNIHEIYQGQEHITDKSIVVSTWQSIYKKGKTYFDQFDFVIVDEVHELKATSLTGILEKCTKCPYKIGLTGTLDDVAANEMVIEGLIGPRQVIAKSKELMDRGDIAGLHINVMTLKYGEKECMKQKKFFSKYQDEVAYTINHKKRNRLIANLALSRPKNTIVLFTRIEHGKELAELISNQTDRKVYLVYGKVELEERDQIKKALETDEDSILVASYSTFSTGISIKNLHYGIFASSYKSKIKVLQSIGRGVRQHEQKDKFQLYDMVDDFSYKKHENHLLHHFIKRFKYYTREGYDYDIMKIDM